MVYQHNPSKIKWDLANGPLNKLLELLDTQVFFGVRSVGPVGDFLDINQRYVFPKWVWYPTQTLTKYLLCSYHPVISPKSTKNNIYYW